MDNKELKVIAPEGYEIDREKSSFEKIVFKKIKKPEPKTYEEVADLLFRGKKGFHIGLMGDIHELAEIDVFTTRSSVASTEAQLEWVLALNKLQTVANYLNGDWKPNWIIMNDPKFSLYYNKSKEKIDMDCHHYYNFGIVYFKTRELAWKAVEILGEETIKTALGVYKYGK